MNSSIKKTATTLLILSALAAVPVSAAAGDVAGNLYYTDIKTYIYQSPITSYNIGGKTVIDAEILNWHYGFDVYWYADTRRLEITDKGGSFNSFQAMSGELVEGSEGKVGDVSGQYYETDIVTTLNGKEIEAYNIGGRTFFVAEKMRDFGYTVDWDETARTLTISKPADFYKIETDYGTIKSDYPHTIESGMQFVQYKNNFLTFYDEGNGSDAGYLPMPDGTMFTNTSGTIYVKLSELVKILDADCHIEEETVTGHTSLVNGIEYDADYYAYALCFDFDKSNLPELLSEMPTDRSGHEFITFDSGYRLSPAFYINGSEAEMAQITGARGTRTFHLYVMNGEIYLPMYSLMDVFGYTVY